MNGKTDEWSRLMAAALNGDQRSYDRLLRELVPVLQRIIHRRAPGLQVADVDDIVQETLRSLHMARQTYRPSRPFLPWVAAIAEHRLLDHRRAHGRRDAREESLDTVDETFLAVPANNGHDPGFARPALERAIADLPPRQRQAIHLLRLKEMTLREAADHSGLSIAALKVASHRAVKALRKVLGEGEAP